MLMLIKRIQIKDLVIRLKLKAECLMVLVLINIGKCLLLIIIIPPFLNYASLQREGQMLLPKDGQIVDISLGQKMHLLCKGQGKPVVILDAPTGMSSDIWFHIQESVATLTKVCTYDRMGLGFSKRMMQNETTGTEKVWGMSTTGRMVDDLHRLLQAAGIAKPFILVGSELGALNGRFYSHIHDVQVSDLVLIDPIPEDIFEEDQWKEYWYGKLLPSFQARQFSAATGLSRMLIILGAIEPTIKGENVSEEVIQRQDGASVRIIMSPPQQRFEWMMIAGAFVFISSETVNLA
ncbi:uncharacterized protein si:dkey-122a22.2 isoform X2 [Lates calcarifer]|uniref:Uncharacterized protein si:dkey-122a22.2 isoform X2 n=1 Tax=Lates calcarifer TaxID=8187 RepID=A0AAJ8BG70_LATCA|nr:uncharacterized protein si:dkey-122a22.2 isoform X2 [Lates calcarifer]